MPSIRHTSPSSPPSPGFRGQSTYRDAFRGQSFTLGADWASSLRTQIAKSSPYCRHCLRHSPEKQADQSIVPSLVAFLPAERSIPQDSIVRLQGLNQGAYSHPCLVLLESECKHLVFVAPMTSFNGTDLCQKYSHASPTAKHDVFWRHLSIDHPQRSSPNDLDSLSLLDGDSLPKASYLNLSGGYWIEKSTLAPFNAGQRKRLSLTQSALAYARWAYGVAERHRAGLSMLPPKIALTQTALNPGVAPFVSHGRQAQTPAWRPSAVPYSVAKNAVSWRRG